MIAICALPTEKEFEHLEWLLKTHYKKESCYDVISRKSIKQELQGYHDFIVNSYGCGCFDNLAPDYKTRVTGIADCIAAIENEPSLTIHPNTGQWINKTKVKEVYDIAGVKTWGMRCQCEKCGFETVIIEDFGYYDHCSKCGAKMEEVDE